MWNWYCIFLDNPDYSAVHFLVWYCNNEYETWVYFRFSPVTGLEWPRGFQEVKVPRFHDNGAQDGGKVVSLTHRPSLPPGNAPGTHFC